MMDSLTLQQESLAALSDLGTFNDLDRSEFIQEMNVQVTSIER